jgi:hypothetical protein
MEITGISSAEHFAFIGEHGMLYTILKVSYTGETPSEVHLFILRVKRDA